LHGRIGLLTAAFLFAILSVTVPLSKPVTGPPPSPQVEEVVDLPLQLAMVSVVPASVNTHVGQYFTVSLTVSDVVDLYGWELRLGWNSTLLGAVSISEGPFLKTGGNTFFSPKTYNAEGYILVDCTLLGPISGVDGDGVLTTVTFYTESEGACPLVLYGTILLNSSENYVTHQTVDGSLVSSRALPSTNTSCGGDRRPPLHK
jgi:hypothetical protein